MELKIRNGDYIADGIGGERRADGAEALLERALFRLSVRRGSFPFLPELGSELYRLGHEKPSARAAAAKLYTAAALAEETALTVEDAELYAAGEGLDAAAEALEKAAREGVLMTAEDEGLSRRERLFSRVGARTTPALRRLAIASLLRVGGDGFTLEAVNQTISGCGVRAVAAETDEQGVVRVTFPQVAGEPEDFARIRDIILEIMPCHLQVDFYFRFLTWEECEAAAWTWQGIEDAGHTWESFEKAVPTV